MKNISSIKLYLDIDGVLLTEKNTRAQQFSKPFIKFITEKFDCYWLTTHCKGDASTAIKYLSDYFSEDEFALLKKIKPTMWDALKTEAIDFENVFIWIDDMPFEAEKKVLREKNTGYLIAMNPTDNLNSVKEKLEEILKRRNSS
jgi:hypothetical protein